MNEFSRLYPLETLSDEPRRVEIEARPDELEALARRFGLLSLDGLTAQAELRRTGEAATAAGRLRARVVQSCVASAEPVEAEVAEEFQVDFRPLPAEARPEEEIELGESELDVVFYEGEAIDLGEAVAQTLLLGLDPYPRSPAAEAALRDAGVKSEEEARIESSPFAALAALKGKLEE
ncbi:MAG: hypothetical protein QOJ91_2146 [Sphingomonadales bacterium]|jgi:uncharacterized metal-binding protein YceD (DUF177 family)|nr:hypothetical protein [Sphingomonadales bacterium]